MGYQMWFSDYFPSCSVISWENFLLSDHISSLYLCLIFIIVLLMSLVFALMGFSEVSSQKFGRAEGGGAFWTTQLHLWMVLLKKNINDLKFEPHLTWIKECYLEMCEVLVLVEHPVANWTGRDIFCGLNFLLTPVSSNFCSVFRVRSVNRLRFTRL